MAILPQLSIMPIKKMYQWIHKSASEDVAILIAASYDTACIEYPTNSHIEIFDDIDFECLGRSFTMAQARNYAEFIKSLPPSTQTFICACNAGESRSAALCAALCEYYNVDSSWIWDSPHYHPNMLVFDLFTQALGLKISDMQKDSLFFRNKQAFTHAISQARVNQTST